jgi:hypothetical protein
MTDTEFTIGMIIALNIFISFGFTGYFQYGKLSELEHHLDGNESVEWNRTVWGSGFIGRQMRLNMIVVTILMARRLHRNGFLGKDEEKKIPKNLRIQLLAAYAYESVAVLSSFIFYFMVIAD